MTQYCSRARSAPRILPLIFQLLWAGHIVVHRPQSSNIIRFDAQRRTTFDTRGLLRYATSYPFSAYACAPHAQISSAATPPHRPQLYAGLSVAGWLREVDMPNTNATTPYDTTAGHKHDGYQIAIFDFCADTSSQLKSATIISRVLPRLMRSARRA